MEPLLPIRHAQKDLFICDLFDTWKDDMGSMEHPIFSLSTKPDKRRRKYEHNGNTIEIIPSDFGLATIHDKDVLLYLASHIMNDINEKREEARKNKKKEIEPPPKRIHFTAYDMLFLTNRTTNNLGYRRLEAALDRLSGTRIKTNIRTNGRLETENFGIIDAFGIVRENQDDENSRMTAVQVKLSDWFYNALLGNEVLTISESYFRLRKPLERRIYELCRKHCGTKKPKWQIGLDKLRKKTGAASPTKEFKRMVKKIVETDHMPDYHIEFDNERNVLIVRPRVAPVPEQKKPLLKSQTYINAGEILRPYGLDKYGVEEKWLEFWRMTGSPELKTPDGAFINFCKKQVE